MAALRKTSPGIGKAPVFSKPSGALWSKQMVQYRWEATLENAKDLPEDLRVNLRLHDCRHTFATLLINAGAKLEVIAELMGHSQLYCTTIYAHLMPETKKRAVDALRQALKHGRRNAKSE